MKTIDSLRYLLSIISVSLLPLCSSQAQTTYTWSNSNITATPPTLLDWFSGGTNTQGIWTGGDPVSSNLNTIRFFGDATTALTNTAAATQTVNLNNGGSAFQLGTLTLNGLGSATANANMTMNLSGDALNFSGATGTINLNALNATRTITYNVNNNIQLGTTSSGSVLTLGGLGTGTFNFGGIISELQSGGGSLIKSGTSTANLTSANSYSGSTTINGGTMNLSGNAGSINLSSGVTANSGATLGLDNSTNIVDRIKDDATLTLNGATLNFTGRGSSGSATEIIGTLAVGAGASTITLTGAGSGTLQSISASAFSRTANATALIRGASLQAAATNATRLSINGGTGLDLIGGGTANNGVSTAGTITTLSIVPYLMGDTSNSGAGSSFLTYDTSGALRPLAAGEYTTLTAGYTTPSTQENVNAFNGSITTTSDVTLNSLRFNNTQALNGSGGALIVNSGAIALTTNNAASIGSGFSGLTLGNGTWNEGIIHVSSNTLTINTPVTVTGGGSLIKTGASTLAVNAPINVSGGVVVNAGILSLANAQPFNGGIKLNGGTLTNAGTTDSLGAVGSTITVNANSSLSLNGATLLNKSVVLNGNAVLSMVNGSGTTDFTGAVTGTGGLHLASRKFTFQSTSNTFTGAVSITANTVGGEFVFGSLYDGLGAGNLITNPGSGTNAFALGTTAVAPYTLNHRQFVHANNSTALVVRNDNTNPANIFTVNTDLVVSGAASNRTLQLDGANTGVNRWSTNLTDWSGGTLGLTKNGNSNWALGGTNTYTGATVVTGSSTSGDNRLIFQGLQAISSNTTLEIRDSSSSQGRLVFLDDNGGSSNGTITSRNMVPITFRSSQSSAAGGTNFFVGNNNSANGGSSAGTATGNTIALGAYISSPQNFGSTGDTVNILGANGYKLQLASIAFPNLSTKSAASTFTIRLNPTTASLIIAGNVTPSELTSNTNSTPILQLDGTASGNEINGSISNPSNFPTSNALALTKSSTSTWTLGGTNLYTGATSITGGLLRITGDSSAATGNVTISGGALGGNGGSLGGAVTVSSTGGINLADRSVGSLTLGSTLGITGSLGANNLTFDLGNATGTSDSLVVAGSTTVTTTGSAVINVNQLGGSAGRPIGSTTTYTLIGGAGTLDATNFAKFSLATTKAFGQTFLLTNAGNDLQLEATNVTGAVATNTTHNVVSGSWQATGSFTGAAVPDYQSNVIINSAVGTTPLNGSTNINSLTFGTSATTAVTISPGTATAQTNASMIVIEAGAANGNTAGNGITLSNTSGTHIISSNIGLASSQTWSIAGTTGGLSVSGAITDFGAGYALTKDGGGTLTLTGATNYTGGTTITGGIASFAAASMGALNAGPISLSGGGRLTLASANASSTSQFSVGTGGGLLFVNKNNNFTTTGILTGSGTLTLLDGGGSGTPSTYNFNSISNDFTGAIVASNATLNVNSLRDSGNNIVFNSTLATAVVANNVGLKYGSTAINPLTLNNRAIEFNSAVTSNVLIQNNNTTQAITIGTNLVATGAGAKTLMLDAVAGPTNVFGGSITDGSGGGTVALNKSSAGIWNLTSASNTFTGAITANAGTLSYASAGGGNGITFSNTTGSAILSYIGATDKTMSGTFNISTVTTGTVNLDSSGAGAVNYSNTSSMGTAGSGNKNLILSGTNTGNNTLAGGWNNNSGGVATITKNGAGRWTLSGTNAYTGKTTVNAGTLQFAKMASLYNNTPASWTPTNINVLAGATLAVNVDSAGTDGFNSSNLNTLIGNISTGVTTAALGLQNGATIGIDTSTATGATFTQGNAITNSTGTFGGGIGLTKLGTGRLVLDKTNTYTGATNITSGTLEISGSGSINSTSAINVAGGASFIYNSSTALTVAPTLNGTEGNRASFSGSGTISAPMTLNSLDSVLAPGNSPGIQVFGVSQIWESFTYEWELNDWANQVPGTGGNIDQIQITGGLTLSGTSYALNIFSLDALNAAGLVGANGGNLFTETSKSWTILTTTTGISGFNASTWTLDTAGFLDEEAGSWSLASTGNDLVLSYTVIPEPKAALLGGLGILLLFRRRR